jgi:outer membrane receptor protein involved in Fe transport
VRGEPHLKRRTIGLVAALPLILVISTAVGQPSQTARIGGSVSGCIIDSTYQFPLQYANIILYNASTGDQATGGISGDDGCFELAGVRPGAYYLEVKFMGYFLKTIEDIRMNRAQPVVDLATIELRQAVISMEGVEVEGEVPAVEFEIDRKVINVSKQPTAASGTAVDVLENVPSVTVDIEGNVSLRGSTSFTVLIDNRPTVMDPSDVLQQIPASTIESIEIITNPSAKYDPDGVTGIINVVTKKAGLNGINGIVNLDVGLEEKYGGDFLLNFRRSKFSAYFGADYSRRVYPGSSEQRSETRRDSITSYTSSTGDSRWERDRYGLRGGVDLFLSPDDVLSLAMRYGTMEMARDSESDFDEWTSADTVHNLYTNDTDSERSGDFYSVNLNHRHTFDADGHELSGSVDFGGHDGEEESISELRTEDGALTEGQKTEEDGPSNRVRAQVDYILPFATDSKLEAGYQLRSDRSENETKNFEFDPDNGSYEYRPEYSHSTEYTRDIHSLYALYSAELGDFGYKAGLRGEYTDRSIELVGEDDRFTIDRWDVFPTAHASYQYSDLHQVMASYTRRIDRPRHWYLEPFLTWFNAYNVRTGNPDLEPEYIDAYELAYQMQSRKSMFSAEAYYRVTHDKTERVQSVYEENVILHSVDNVGKDYTLGVELMLNLRQLSWLDFSLMGNLYDYRVEGELDGDPFSEETFSWNVRSNNTFKITKSTRVQLTGMYNGPRVSSQGDREEFVILNGAVAQDFLDKKLSAVLQVRDIFGTGEFEHSSEGKDFYSWSKFTRESPMVTLTLTYKFNDYKPDRTREDGEEVFEGIEEF